MAFCIINPDKTVFANEAASPVAQPASFMRRKQILQIYSFLCEYPFPVSRKIRQNAILQPAAFQNSAIIAAADAPSFPPCFRTARHPRQSCNQCPSHQCDRMRSEKKYFADNRKSIIFAFHKNNGALAERLGTGLQNLLQRFDSARHLQKNASEFAQGHLSYIFVTELILNFGADTGKASGAVGTLKAYELLTSKHQDSLCGACPYNESDQILVVKQLYHPVSHSDKVADGCIRRTQV